MDKLTKILFIIWCVLAVSAFVSSFFVPLIPKIIGIVFGSVNLLIIGSWISSIVQARREYKRQQKLIAEKLITEVEE